MTVQPLAVPRDRAHAALAAAGLSVDALRTDFPGVYETLRVPCWGITCTMRQLIEFTGHLAASGVNVVDLARRSGYSTRLVGVPRHPDQLVMYFTNSVLTDDGTT